MTNRVDGKKIALEIEQNLRSENDLSPQLEIIQVGKNPASNKYIEEKLAASKRVGFKASLNQFSENIEQDKLIEKIRQLNKDNEVNGILIQLPLPDHINNDHVFNAVLPQKDVDGLTPLNLGKTLRGEKHLIPSSVKAIEKILEYEKIDLEGKTVTIINNSNLIGKPLSMVLTKKGATTTLCHRKTENLKKHTREADIIVTATGQPGLLEKDMVTEDTFVIDAGYGPGATSEAEKVENKVANISPEPGGVGPITVAMTLKNLLKCYRLQN
jgi:methylenetetrahydrofolate dehydrogenase (NADP+)/methenyltetrahydrofolate cyclohydrolase